MVFNVTDMINTNITKKDFEITEIEIDKIIENEDNFYKVEDVEELKESILAIGLQHNLTVAEGSEDGFFTIISGHRRFKAIKQLKEEEKIEIETVPCKIDNSTELEQKLTLILSNSTSRELTSFEKMKQVSELKKLAIEIKASSNTKIKGKTRDFIANMLQMSKTEVARYEAIEKNLTEEIKEEFEQNNISADTAYEISKLDEDKQEKATEKIKEAKINNKKITTKDVKEFINNEDESIEQTFEESIPNHTNKFDVNEIESSKIGDKYIKNLEKLLEIIKSNKKSVDNLTEDSLLKLQLDIVLKESKVCVSLAKDYI